MKYIQLTKGYKTLVDDEDFEYLNQWKWFVAHGRAARSIRIKGTKKKRGIFMHRLIINTPIGMDTDHIDRNPLNNQKSNLRIATHTQNLMNRITQKNNSSGYKGIRKKYKGFEARIQVYKKDVYLGYFKTATEAAKAYDQGAKKYYGEYARGNFI